MQFYCEDPLEGIDSLDLPFWDPFNPRKVEFAPAGPVSPKFYRHSRLTASPTYIKSINRINVMRSYFDNIINDPTNCCPTFPFWMISENSLNSFNWLTHQIDKNINHSHKLKLSKFVRSWIGAFRRQMDSECDQYLWMARSCHWLWSGRKEWVQFSIV